MVIQRLLSVSSPVLGVVPGVTELPEELPGVPELLELPGPPEV
jgi:hypothetical protein